MFKRLRRIGQQREFHECGSGSTNDHHAASKSDGNDGADRDVHGSGDGDGTARLPVEEEQHNDRWSDGGELYDADDEFG